MKLLPAPQVNNRISGGLHVLRKSKRFLVAEVALPNGDIIAVLPHAGDGALFYFPDGADHDTYYYFSGVPPTPANIDKLKMKAWER